MLSPDILRGGDWIQDKMHYYAGIAIGVIGLARVVVASQEVQTAVELHQLVVPYEERWEIDGMTITQKEQLARLQIFSDQRGESEKGKEMAAEFEKRMKEGFVDAHTGQAFTRRNETIKSAAFGGGEGVLTLGAGIIFVRRGIRSKKP